MVVHNCCGFVNFAMTQQMQQRLEIISQSGAAPLYALTTLLYFGSPAPAQPESTVGRIKCSSLNPAPLCGLQPGILEPFAGQLRRAASHVSNSALYTSGQWKEQSNCWPGTQGRRGGSG